MAFFSLPAFENDDVVAAKLNNQQTRRPHCKNVDALVGGLSALYILLRGTTAYR